MNIHKTLIHFRFALYLACAQFVHVKRNYSLHLRQSTHRMCTVCMICLFVTRKKLGKRTVLQDSALRLQ